MKPIKLEIEGLNSFETKQVLDFEKLGSGVFGIFGKTGSGKSTILDAITLALYGKIERTKQNIDFVNTKCQKAVVNFVFEIFQSGKNKRYKVSRTFSRKKNGKELDASASIYELVSGEENLIEEGTVKVNDKVFSIIGLGVREFEKCIALPQGEFSAFLQAKASERTEIMSNIFDITRFGEPLAEKVKQKVAEFDKEVSILSASQQMVAYATDELLAESKKNSGEVKVDYETKSKLLEVKQAEQKRAQGDFEKLEKLKAINAELLELGKKKEEMQELEVSLSKSQSANAIRSDYEKLQKDIDDERELSDKIAEQNEIKLKKDGELHSAEIEFENFKEIYQAKIAELNSKLARLQDLKKFEEETKALESERTSVEEKIKKKQAELVSERGDNDYMVATLTTIQGKITAIDEFIEANKPDVDLSYALEQVKGIESELILIEDFHKKLEVLVDETEADLKAVQEEYNSAIKSEKEYQAKREQIESSIEVAFEDIDSTDFRKLRSCDKELENMLEVKIITQKIDEFIAKLQQENVERAEVVEALENQVDAEYRKLDAIDKEISKCEKVVAENREQREELLGDNVISMISNHLRIGDSCPVCSNRVVQKMYSETNDLSSIEGEIDRSVSNVKLTHLERDKIIANMVSLKARCEFEKTQIEANLSEIQALSDGKVKYFQRFVDISDDSEEDFNRLYALLQKTSDSLEELIALQDTLREAEKRILIQKTQAGTKVTIYKNYLERLIDIIYDLQKKQAEREFAISTVNERFENLKEYKKQIAEGKNIEIVIDTKKEERIKLKDDQLRVTGEKAQSDAKISEIRTAIEVLNERVSNIDKQIASLRAKIITSGVPENVSVDEEALATQAEVTRLKFDYENKQIAYDSSKEALSRIENEYKINSSILAEKREEIKVLQANVNKAMSDGNFTSREELEKCFVDNSLLKANQARVNEYNDSVRLLTSQKQGIEAENLPELTKEKLAEIVTEIQGLSEEVNTLAQKLGRLEGELSRVEEDNKKLHEITVSLNDFKHKYDTAKELSSVLRGKALAEYVCEEYLEEITLSANQKLSILMDGRYTLKFEEKEFFVEDNFNDGKVRPASTLSGGETFIVSLSLALSISDAISMLSSRSMDFFFLDEGFGTLDSELCSVVISSLHKLESQNLTIGLISHVAELEESVKNKVLITKDANGSKIKVEHSL